MTATASRPAPRFEILDGMECRVATADCLDDAIFAAEKYAPAVVVRVSTGKVIYTATTAPAV